MADIDFRKVFRPIQPTIGKRMDVQYIEWMPAAALTKYIFCYWRLQSTGKLPEPFVYRVIPDGCIDIFVNRTNASDCRIMGFSTSHKLFQLDDSFDYIGIRFLPAAVPRMFGLDASALTNSEEDLFAVLPRLAEEMRSEMDREASSMDIKAILNKIFLKQLQSLTLAEDKRLYNAIHILLHTHGGLRVKSDIDTGVSPRQLRRMFQHYVGDTPKAFSKVVRFQYFFRLLSSDKGSTYNNLFLEAGYYDQPHFTKEFKTFYGLTPGEALSR